jgi:hypothetical protein
MGTLSSQKSEVRKSMRQRNELRQGLRGRVIISALLHFLWSSGIHTEIKDYSDTGHARSYFTRNLAIKIEGKTINDNTAAEKVHHNSISE